MMMTTMTRKKRFGLFGGVGGCVGAIMMVLIAQIASPRKRGRGRQLSRNDSSTWVESSDSPLINADLRQLITFENFDTFIPPEQKDELLKV